VCRKRMKRRVEKNLKDGNYKFEKLLAKSLMRTFLWERTINQTEDRTQKLRISLQAFRWGVSEAYIPPDEWVPVA
jgi:hypothetical protein